MSASSIPRLLSDHICVCGHTNSIHSILRTTVCYALDCRCLKYELAPLTEPYESMAMDEAMWGHIDECSAASQGGRCTHGNWEDICQQCLPTERWEDGTCEVCTHPNVHPDNIEGLCNIEKTMASGSTTPWKHRCNCPNHSLFRDEPLLPI